MTSNESSAFAVLIIVCALGMAALILKPAQAKTKRPSYRARDVYPDCTKRQLREEGPTFQMDDGDSLKFFRYGNKQPCVKRS